MLLFADFLPPLTLPPHCQGPQRGGQLERACRTRGGASALLPGSPGVRWDQGMDPVSAKGSPLPSRPHARGAGREAFPPPSLPLRQWRENWVRQALSSCWLVGGGGGRTAVSPRPAEPSRGEDGDGGPVGSPIPTHIPDGVSELEGAFSSPLNAAQTCPYPGAVSANVHHLGSSPPELHNWWGSCLQTPLSRPFPPRKPHHTHS